MLIIFSFSSSLCFLYVILFSFLPPTLFLIACLKFTQIFLSFLLPFHLKLSSSLSSSRSSFSLYISSRAIYILPFMVSNNTFLHFLFLYSKRIFTQSTCIILSHFLLPCNFLILSFLPWTKFLSNHHPLPHSFLLFILFQSFSTFPSFPRR